MRRPLQDRTDDRALLAEAAELGQFLRAELVHVFDSLRRIEEYLASAVQHEAAGKSATRDRQKVRTHVRQLRIQLRGMGKHAQAFVRMSRERDRPPAGWRCTVHPLARDNAPDTPRPGSSPLCCKAYRIELEERLAQVPDTAPATPDDRPPTECLDSEGCVAQRGHAGPHIYRCASPHCPGMPWRASNTPHPVPRCF